MQKQKTPFKNVYLIDMKKLAKQPIDWTPNGAVLPIEKMNDIPTDDKAVFTKLFSERHTKRMIDQYPVLFPIINRKARTIIEYIAADGKPLITLYPNADVDIHNQDWQVYMTRPAREDLIKMYDDHKKMIEAMRGVLMSLKK